MGIYGALSTAVTGLQAQSFALENISGNIANSQTTGYKRVETSFVDLIPDGTPTKQTAGSVIANSTATNNVQGDISSSSTATNMAINGSGFFVVQQKTGEADGSPTFSGATYYTRRGDFDVDKSGNLVNGAGYYLEGLPIDSTTGNVSGSVPSVIKVSNATLPALQTTSINYQLNLPQLPQDGSYVSGTVGSELLKAADFGTATAPATATGSTTLTGTALASTAMAPGESMSVNIGGTTTKFDFYDSSVAAYAGTNQGIDVKSPITIATALADVQTKLRAAGGTNAASAVVDLNSSGNAEVMLGSNLTASMTVTDTTTGLGIGTRVANATGPVSTIPASGSDAFLNASTSGGAITVYAANGAPVSVQMRWAKTDSAAAGGTDTWNLFTLTNSAATGSQPMWTNAGVNYTFDASGALNPSVTSTPLNNLTVNGVSVGDVTLQFGTNGITQFADSSGTASVTTQTQNGYPAGKYTSVAVDSSGRVVASYSNGKQIDVAQVVTANFNGADALKRLDGGAFAETTESGSPVLSTTPSIAGSSLEASNTDISSEFSQLIVTQQAYAAGAKIVTSANDMLQQALNMIR